MSMILSYVALFMMSLLWIVGAWLGPDSTVKFKFIWYDLWVGLYWDRNAEVLYACPFPCCVFSVRQKRRR